MDKKVSELELSKELPGENEFVLPVYFDNTNWAHKKLRIRDIINYIKEEVHTEGEISVIEVDNGFKFVKKRRLVVD